MESNRSKYILIGLTAVCILLIGITSFKDGFLEPLRTSMGYFLIPVQSGVNRAGTSLYNSLLCLFDPGADDILCTGSAEKLFI